MARERDFMEFPERCTRVFSGQPLAPNVPPGSMESILESVSLLGYCILPFGFEDSIESVSAEIDRLYRNEVEGYGADKLALINDLGVVRNPFIRSKLTRALITDDRLLSVIERIFNFEPILHVNRFVISDPDLVHPASVWHREPPYNNFIAQSPLSVTVIHFPNGSNSENSGVKIMPCSHRWPNFPSDHVVQLHEVTLEIPPGGILAFDSNLFHCGGEPGSELRRSIVTIYTTPTIKQQTNIAATILEHHRHLLEENSRYPRLLGITTNPHLTDLNYRNSKLNLAKTIG